MGNRAFKISIDNPCKQDWDAMPDHAKGKFCMECSRDLVDFSRMSDQEIIAVIAKTGNKICGRFTEEQLDRPIDAGETKQHPGFMRNLLAACFLLFNMLFGEMRAQTLKRAEVSQVICTEPQLLQHGENPPVAADTIVIKGSVCDGASGMFLDHALIELIGTDMIWETDMAGNFLIEIPDSLCANDSLVFEVMMPGYKQSTMTVYKRSVPAHLKHYVYRPRRTGAVLGGAAIQSIHRSGWW